MTRREPECFVAQPDVPFLGDVDVDEVVATCAGITVKGVFCKRFGAAIGEAAWPSAAAKLEAPPARGVYHAFESYPLADYYRLVDAVARQRFDRMATREAYRLLGRGEIDVFSETTFGKVSLAMIKEPGVALARYPELLGMIARGVRGTADRRARGVLLRFPKFVGSVDMGVGVFEGVVLAFDAKPRIEVVLERGGASFDVSW